MRPLEFIGRMTRRDVWAAVVASPWPVLAGAALIAAGQWVWFQDVTTSLKGALFAAAGIALVVLGTHAVAIAPARPILARRRLVAWRIAPRLLLIVAGVWLCVDTGVAAIDETETVWTYLGRWFAGIALTIGGLVPPRHAAAWWRDLRASLRAERRTWLLLGALLGVALAMRIAFLETVPYIQAGDEAQFAQEAVSVSQNSDWHFSPFQMGIWHHPRTVHTLMAVSIEALGHTKSAARMPWAILGALTVPAVYFMGRRLLGGRVGWAAAIYMATFPVHVQFSRTGMDMTGDPLFAALAFGLLAGALRRGNLLDAALAGAAGGLTQYFYFAGRIVPLLLAGFAALCLIRSLRERRVLIAQARIVAVTAGVLVVTVFPYFYSAYRDTARGLTPRLNAVGVWQTESARRAAEEGQLTDFVVDQVREGLLAYVQVQDQSDVFGKYGSVLGWFAGVPFMVGLGVALRRWREPRAVIPAIWVLGTATLGGVMLIDPPHYPRYISATPALAVLVGVGIVALSGALSRALALGNALRPDAVRQLQGVLPVLLALALSAADAGTYTLDYLPRTRTLLYGERTIQLNEVANIIDSFDGTYQVHLLSSLDLDMAGTDIIRYLVPESTIEEFDTPLYQLPNTLAEGWHAFVIAPGERDAAAELSRRLPEGELIQYMNPRADVPLVYIYFYEMQ